MKNGSNNKSNRGNYQEIPPENNAAVTKNLSEGFSAIPSIQPQVTAAWTKKQGLICFMVVGIIVLVVYCDYDHLRYILQQVVAWMKENPYPAVGLIISAYTLSLIFLLPTIFIQLLCGYIYAKSMQSVPYGLLIAVPVAFTGA